MLKESNLHNQHVANTSKVTRKILEIVFCYTFILIFYDYILIYLMNINKSLSKSIIYLIV